MKQNLILSLVALCISVVTLIGALHWAWTSEHIRNSFWLFYAPIPFLGLFFISIWQVKRAL